MQLIKELRRFTQEVQDAERAGENHRFSEGFQGCSEELIHPPGLVWYNEAFRPGTESAAQGFGALAPWGGLPTAFFVIAVGEGAKKRAKALKRDAGIRRSQA